MHVATLPTTDEGNSRKQDKYLTYASYPFRLVCTHLVWPTLPVIVAKIFIYRWRHWYYFKMFSTGGILVGSAFYYFITGQTEEIKQNITK